jgi:ribosome-associated protein
MATERNVAIRTDSIELAALLKWAQVVHSGGEAKQLIQDGRVRVNGEVERRRGRKVALGDNVEIDGLMLVVTKPEAQSPKP